MEAIEVHVDDLSDIGPELEEEQLAAVMGGCRPRSGTAWVCGCTDTDEPF
jgi:hypothetical protein